MNFDFSALLVLLTFTSGGIWAFDAWFLAPRRADPKSGEIDDLNEEETISNEPLFVEYARSFFPIFLIVLILRSFIVEPFRIPSASMMPTLLIGDFILVNKFDYGIRLPVINSKIVDNGKPERGDIIVFRYPEDPSIPFIKRVVGVPGDHLSYYNKTLYINDIEMEQSINGRYVGQGAGKEHDGKSWRHEMLGDVNHEILVDTYRPSSSFEIIVPEGKYFVFGDNRDNSKDSRYWGFVPDENLVGRAFLIWMNWDRMKRGSVATAAVGTIP